MSAAAGPGAVRRLLIVGAHEAARLLLEVVPAAGAESDQPRVLVLARERRRDPLRVAALARALFGLTPTEAAIAAELVCGRTPYRIAESGGSSIDTVRCHIRRIYQKAEVRSVVELLSLIPA
jgi:DNA-binding CsgD family transcriptional regulator